MLGRYICNQFLDQYRLPYSGSTKQTDLSTLLVRTEKVNNLNTCLQHLCLGRLLFKCRRFPVDGVILLYLWRRFFINRISQNIEHPAKRSFSHRHCNRRSGGHSFHSPHKSVRRSHSDTTHRIVTEMLGHLHDKLFSLFRRYTNRIIDFRKRAFLKSDVKYCTYNLSDHSRAVSSFIFCHCDLFTPFYSIADAPATISVNS